jgi:RND family efflux transporter MFP subunit
MKPASWLVSVISGAAALLALGLFAFGTRPWQRFLDNDAVIVAIAEVTRESRPVVLRVSGELRPAVEVNVVPRVAGRLTEVRFKTGDTVNAGAVVASVYTGELTERVRLVEAELKVTRKQLQDSEQQAAETDKQFSRYQDLYRQDLIARRDVEQAEIQAATNRAQLDLLRAQIAQQEAMLTQVRKLQQFGRVVAPISGLVTGALSAGTPVNEARAILTIAQIDNLKLLGEVPARYTTLVRDGMAAQVSARQGSVEVRAGKVVRLDGNIKSDGAAMPIEIRVDNRDRALQIGATVDATLSLERQEQVITIPRSALQSAADQHYVYRVVDGRAVRRLVELDDANSDPIVIRAGLKAGDQVVIDRMAKIKEGMRVHPAMQAQSP